MADTALPDMNPKPKGGFVKKLLVWTIAAAVLGGGGFAAGLYFSGGSLSPSQEVLRLIETEKAAETEADGTETKRVQKEVPETAVFQTSYYEFPDPLTTNLKGSRRFLQVGIGVSTQYDASVITNVETHAMALRSDMLAVISGFAEADVEGEEGRAQLSRDLMRAMNARLEALEGFGGIEDVFFPSFVLQ